MTNDFMVHSAIHVTVQTAVGGIAHLAYGCSLLMAPILGIQAVARMAFIYIAGSIIPDIKVYQVCLLSAAFEPVLCVAGVVTCLALGILTPPAFGIVIAASAIVIVRQLINSHQVYHNPVMPH